MKIKVSASLLACDKNKIIEEVKKLKENNVDCVHFDVMDNVFVPNTSFNDDTFKRIREYTSLPFEIHLMVENPNNYINDYGNNKEDIIIIHYECFSEEKDLLACINNIKLHHKVGLSIKPNTPVEKIKEYLKYLDYVLIMSVEPGFGGQKFMPSALEKIKELKSYQKDYHYVIEVDGGINDITSKLCNEAGVDILVSGSYLFKGNMKEKVESLK
ncbi:ribulose-phosphate 3-epimerase [Firmicutes bacterium CAG:449]|nr:ribulose-phosphate 3-epimerase [Firmicutes bacterium CAG:449]